MLVIILLSVATPTVSDMTALEQFSANLANPAEGDKLTDEWAAKWKADRQAVAYAKSRKHNPPYKCPPWKPSQKGGLLKLVSVDDLLNRTPNELEECADKRAEDAAAYYNRTHPRLTEYQRQQAHVKSITGGNGLSDIADVDLTAVDHSDIIAAQAASTQTQSWKDNQSFGDRFEASILDTNLIQAFIRALDDSNGPADPEWGKTYLKRREIIEGFAENQDEVDQMRESENQDDLAAIQYRIMAKRDRTKIIDSSGNGHLFRAVPYVALAMLLLLVGLVIAAFRRPTGRASS